MKWLSWLRLASSGKPKPNPSPTACPECGDEMVFVEKFTMLGDDLRTYRCKRCQRQHTIDFGTAMWKIMADANRSDSEN